ncbi:MAG TPA: MBL fold metallo-hydrolase [Bacteroidaceae bacterium]|nr:MBL fold metallo-hydrolase [Bacteroidaceae bacterium]
MRIKFLSLSSGSSGNCYYLGTDEHGILIDAGIPLKQIKHSLRAVDINFDKILAVFVTHDHADHIKSLGNLGERCSIPIYATKETHIGINNNYCMTEKLVSCVRYLEKGITLPFHEFNITAFEVPHDGTDNVGYFIDIGNKSFCFVTDLGHIPKEVASFISKAQYLVIEANYDEDMLRMGNYPQFLKDRIVGPRGHISNRATAEFLASHITEKLKYIWLCHLSNENNHPEIAYKTVEFHLREAGITPGKDVMLTALKRTSPSDLYIFE